MAYIALSVLSLWATFSGAQRTPSVYQGEPDINQRYPYVVTFIRGNQRACTGTLISPNWVLTAGECTFYNDEHRVQYGNLSILPSQAKQTSKVVKCIKHPSIHASNLTPSNLQLVMVETVPFKHYGNVSAADYRSFTGSTVEFASLEVTYRDIVLDPFKLPEETSRPLLLGQGMVTKCDFDSLPISSGPSVCIAPTCEKRFKNPWAGDSGGPLFYAGKVIGLLKGAGNLPVMQFTAVSPFVDWIYLVMSQNSLDGVL